MSYKLVNLKNKKTDEFIQAFTTIPENVDSLDLSNNDLGHRTAAELTQAFVAMPPGVTSLDLKHNGFELKTAAELTEIFQAMPINITSVHLNGEHNDFVDFQKFASIKARIDSEIARLTESKNGFLAYISVVESSEDKIKALEGLKEIFQNGFGKNRNSFHDELRLWKKDNWACINKQRNFIHSFFSPGHKPRAVSTIDEIFAELSVVDKFEANVPSPSGLKNPYKGPFKPSKPASDKKIDKIDKLIEKIDELVLEEEEQTKNKPKKEEDLPKVKEAYIQKLIMNMKDITFSKSDFWNMLDQMSNKDIKLFVSKLGFSKKGKHALSEFDYLWRQFQGLEFEPSQKEKKKNLFTEILESLSEEQLTAAFDSPEFLNILNQDIYAEVVANTLNYKQMALFASDKQRHTILDKMIKKLKPSSDSFSKLVVILPWLSGELRTNLHNQLTHLPHEASFKLEVVELADFYLDINYQAYVAAKPVDPGMKKKEPPPSKWAKINIDLTPKYNDKPVEKIDWTEQAFETFIQDLNAPTYKMKDDIIENLNSMPDDRIKMIVERAALSAYKNLLRHLWSVEATVLNQNSYTVARESRLKIILENLSEAQLIGAVTENKFWEIFGNTQQPYCKMAAEVLTPNQFETIISNVDLDRHLDVARIINLVKKDTPQDKDRLNDIIKAILPHTTPWLVLTLQLKINDLLNRGKAYLKELNTNLKQYLNESMNRDDVFLKYTHDADLNKKAVSELFSDETKAKLEAGLKLGM